jgi:GxxExxY protein
LEGDDGDDWGWSYIGLLLAPEIEAITTTWLSCFSVDSENLTSCCSYNSAQERAVILPRVALNDVKAIHQYLPDPHHPPSKKRTNMTSESQVTERIIKAIIKVHQTLGPGFLERIYHNALVIELTKQGHVVESEKDIPIYYEAELVGTHRLDVLVDGCVIVELKTVEELAGTHYSQLRSYLKASSLRIGLLVNLAKDKADYRRVELKPE